MCGKYVEQYLAPHARIKILVIIFITMSRKADCGEEEEAWWSDLVRNTVQIILRSEPHVLMHKVVTEGIPWHDVSNVAQYLSLIQFLSAFPLARYYKVHLPFKIIEMGKTRLKDTNVSINIF